MPNYHYEHEEAACVRGKTLVVKQAIADAALTRCPHCGGAVFRVILPVGIGAPQSDSDLRGKGFTKLVKRDSGVYENVTALAGESRYVRAGRPETMPDFKRRGLD
ncbi:MAG: zinc ribbon domain-containing protein [Planctomycetota bacterium]|jgi:predicted nucleic acid-binding Zn ribbon protein|nr:zinc ribbon domain-containing protein [Planctomycetota bacterium]